MTVPPELGAYKDGLVFLLTAAVVVPLMQRLRVSPVLAFLAAGAVLGPLGLGRLVDARPWLDWVTVRGGGNSFDALGELGVVFLLFLIGLELSLPRLITMRRLVFGLGGLQVTLSALVLGAGLAAVGLSAPAATVLGACLALSSTAIVVEELSRQRRLARAAGRASFSILLLQDLAVVPLLLLVTILDPGQYHRPLVVAVLQAAGQAVLAIGLIVLAGTLVLKPLFHLVASSRNTELFVAATLLVAVVSGLTTAAAGMSMALGAFVAGLLLAETEFRRAIEATIEPFKGLLLGVFFFTVGMNLDPAVPLASPLPVMGAVTALVAVKAGIVAGLMRFFGFPAPAAIEAALPLGPGGEFAFIIISLALAHGIVSPGASAFALTVTSLSMALIPLLDAAAQGLSSRLAGAQEPDPALADLPPPGQKVQAVVVGYGRVGRLVSAMLDQHGIAHVVAENNPQSVKEARHEGRPVYYGDGKRISFLMRLGLTDASALIITLNDPEEVNDLVGIVRAERPDLFVVARARDAEHARRLYGLGASDAIPETIEASLQLSEASLVGLGVPAGAVIASIHGKRDEYRSALQRAAKNVGQATRAVKPKSLVRKLRAARRAAFRRRRARQPG